MGASAQATASGCGEKALTLNDRFVEMRSVVKGLQERMRGLADRLVSFKEGKGEECSKAPESRGSPEVEDGFGIEGGIKNCLFEFGPRTPSPRPTQVRETTPPGGAKEYSPPPRCEREEQAYEEDPASPRHHFVRDWSPPVRGSDYKAESGHDGGHDGGWGPLKEFTSSKFMEIVRMLERGELPEGIRVDIKAVPPNPWAPLKPRSKTLPCQPWRGKTKLGLHEIGLGLENLEDALPKSGAPARGLKRACEKDRSGFEFSFNVASVEPVSPPKDCAFFSSAGFKPFKFESAGEGSTKKDDVFVFGKGSG